MCSYWKDIFCHLAQDTQKALHGFLKMYSLEQTNKEAIIYLLFCDLRRLECPCQKHPTILENTCSLEKFGRRALQHVIQPLCAEKLSMFLTNSL